MTSDIIGKQKNIDNNIDTMKKRITEVFNGVREALEERENALLEELEATSDRLNLSEAASKVSEMGEEIKRVIATGQEAVKWTKEESSKGSWEVVNRGSLVRDKLNCAIDLESEVTTTLHSIPEVVFKYDKNMVKKKKASHFGALDTLLLCGVDNISGISKGWDSVTLTWDGYKESAGDKKVTHEVEVKKSSERAVTIYCVEEEECTINGLLSNTVYVPHKMWN